MQTVPSPLFAFLCFFILVPVIWLGVCTLIANMGGWTTLAQTYTSDQPINGEHVRVYHAQFGTFIAYQRSLNVIIGTDGISFRQDIHMRFAHPPLRVPWTAVETIVYQTSASRKAVTLIMKAGNGSTVNALLMSEHAFNTVAQQAPKSIETETVEMD